MKRFSLTFLLLVVFSLLACSAFAASAPSGNAHLVIKRSPTMGRDVSLTINIDGKLAGLLSWHRTFETQLGPGSHTITAMPNRHGTAWHGTIQVQANQTYNYTAYWTSGKITLELKR